MLDKKESTKKSSEGLPDIAQDKSKKLFTLVFIGLGVFVVLISFIFGGSSGSKKEQPIDETFTVSTEAPNLTQGNTAHSNSSMQKQPQDATLTPEQIEILQEKQKELHNRLTSPLLLYSNEEKSSTETSQKNSEGAIDHNTQFLNQVSAQDSGTHYANTIGPLNFLVAQGTLISAALESAINSDLPTEVRAIVDAPIYSEDGSQVLIPPGSRLIGTYKSGLLQGQSRVFVVWTRLIIPGGIAINLGSTGVDGLGEAGFGGDAIDRHFWQMFGTAGLLAIIGAGASTVGVNGGDEYNSAQVYRTAISNSFAQSADQSLQQQSAIPPTILVHQGKHFFVFVNHDLNFERAMKRSKNNHNVNMVF